MLVIFPKSPDQNSEIAILFSVVKQPYHYVFGDDLLPHSPHGRGHKLQTLTRCLHIVMVIWKCTDVFRGIFRLGGGGVSEEGNMLGELSLEEFVMGEENFL